MHFHVIMIDETVLTNHARHVHHAREAGDSPVRGAVVGRCICCSMLFCVFQNWPKVRLDLVRTIAREDAAAHATKRVAGKSF
eukprot:SAG22_NODE_23_length_31399_cov_35.631313_21_plen_82_part_00